MRTLLKNAKVIDRGRIFKAHVLIEGSLIAEIFEADAVPELAEAEIIDIDGKYLFPGIIDDQVHFREPGFTYKGSIFSESKAAAAGGVTSFMDMPNTKPQTLTQDLLKEKFNIAEKDSWINYSFYMGCSSDNMEEVLKTDPEKVCGIKVFLGSSTGNMLVDNPEYLEKLFRQSPTLIAVHCEEESIIQKNSARYKEKFGEQIPFSAHPLIRSEEACYVSSLKAVELAKKTGARLHLLHLSTAKELSLLDASKTLEEKRITGEVCVHHLWFCEQDYEKKEGFIKWNPAIKKASDREALREAVRKNIIDVVATDHAPHSFEEKQNSYFNCPSGGPSIQHSLPLMLELYHQGVFELPQIIEQMCHRPALLFGIKKRGFIKKGYYADLCVLDLDCSWTIDKENILYHCGWSPFLGTPLHSKILYTFVNGFKVFDHGNFGEAGKGKALEFNVKGK